MINFRDYIGGNGYLEPELSAKDFQPLKAFLEHNPDVTKLSLKKLLPEEGTTPGANHLRSRRALDKAALVSASLSSKEVEDGVWVDSSLASEFKSGVIKELSMRNSEVFSNAIEGDNGGAHKDAPSWEGKYIGSTLKDAANVISHTLGDMVGWSSPATLARGGASRIGLSSNDIQVGAGHSVDQLGSPHIMEKKLPKPYEVKVDVVSSAIAPSVDNAVEDISYLFSNLCPSMPALENNGIDIGCSSEVGSAVDMPVKGICVLAYCQVIFYTKRHPF